jgi:pimeloyl-ACP methyl ester carboxylesterase
MRDAHARFDELHTVVTPTLEISYAELGPASGEPVVLLHGYPYDIHSYIDVAPILAGRGYRCSCRISGATVRRGSSRA